VVLALLVAAAVAADRALPPFSSLIGFAPPLTALAFIPDLVRDVVYSTPAFFAVVVVWRAHRLRASDPARWSERATIEDFGGRFIDAAALPVRYCSPLRRRIDRSAATGPACPRKRPLGSTLEWWNRHRFVAPFPVCQRHPPTDATARTVAM